MRALILGGSGFLGSAICAQLTAAGEQVCVFDRNPPHAAGVSFIEGDFTRERDWAAVLAGTDVVYHCVATTTPGSGDRDPQHDLDTNVSPTLRLLEAAAHKRIRVVFLSSGGSVYGLPERIPIPENHPTNPICAHGVSKLTVEKYLHFYSHRHGLGYAIARISNPFGEHQDLTGRQGIVGNFIRKALKGELAEVWGDGSIVRDFIYVDDVACALVRLGEYSGPETLFNIGSGCGRSVKDVIRDIGLVTGCKLQVRYTAGRPQDVASNVLDIQKVKTVLGWRPTIGFEEGLRRTVAWVSCKVRETAARPATHA
jgi:UDP-glucose 4-epimerase